MLTMGKADRRREQNVRARIAAQQAAQRKAEQRRRMLALGGTAVVVVAIVVVVVVLIVGRGTKNQAGTSAGSLPASVQAKLNVPASTLASVGVGTAAPSAIKAVGGTPLTASGKPEMLYIGAEWCPFCAAERWAMAVALSRFGTFTPLKGIHSSATDSFPNTATLTFYNSTYTSKYLVFTPVENQDVHHNPLVTPTAAQQAIWTKYDPSNGYPFIDFGNKYIAGTTYNPQVLQGLNWSQIATDLHNPSTPVAQGADGSANLFTAAICKLTGNAPANVCTTAPVAQLEGQL